MQRDVMHWVNAIAESFSSEDDAVKDCPAIMESQSQRNLGSYWNNDMDFLRSTANLPRATCS